MVIDKKTSTLALVSVITIITLVSGLLFVGQMVNASDIVDENTTNLLNSENEPNIEPIQSNENSGDIQGLEFGLPRKPIMFGQRMQRSRHRGSPKIEVSEEFKESVIQIAENDVDVQDLLAQNYNITGVRPIIKTIVDADGTVVTKASSAVLLLELNENNRAIVDVDIEQAQVTKIVILSRTVIEKNVDS